MKFLADMGISPATVSYLRGLGYDAVRLTEIGMERSSDANIIAYAKNTDHIVLTFDLDYPALLALNPASRVSANFFRTLTADPEWINGRLRQALPIVTDALNEGAIVVIEDDRVRLRRFVDL